MNDELKSLLEKFKADNLTDEERTRLGELMNDAGLRKAAMVDGLPEAIFLADENMPTVQWDTYWEGFQERMSHHQQAIPKKTPVWTRWAAAAVIVFIISLAVLPFLPKQIQSDKNADMQQLVYQLQYRRIQDVSPHIQSLLSKDKEIMFDYQKNKITITDHAENIEKLDRMLKMMDRELSALDFRIRFLYPKTPGAGAVIPVGGIAQESFDLTEFNLAEDLKFTAIEDQQFNQDLNNRYRVICLARMDPENLETILANISIFDQVGGEMVFKADGIKLAPDQIYTLRTGKKNETGEELIVALNLESIQVNK